MRPAAVSVIGSVEWERAGGPPLSFSQKLGVLGGAAALVCGHYGAKASWLLGRAFGAASRAQKTDLRKWEPPDSRAAREATEHCRDVSSTEMYYHSLRTYYFSGIQYDLARDPRPIDREALYVAAMMHDVGLVEDPRPESESCFTVGGARAARALLTRAGWESERQDRVAVAITTNLNAWVPADRFGMEAHYMRAGGLVEVIAQEWRVHPENLDEILKRFPRAGFADDAVGHVKLEAKVNPGGRFACLSPLFPMLVKMSKFRAER